MFDLRFKDMYFLVYSGKSTRKNLLTVASLQLSKSRSRLSLAFSKKSLGRQDSNDTTASLPLGNGDTPHHSSLDTNGEAYKKSETSFTKRNIKSQVRDCLIKIGSHLIPEQFGHFQSNF